MRAVKVTDREKLLKVFKVLPEGFNLDYYEIEFTEEERRELRERLFEKLETLPPEIVFLSPDNPDAKSTFSRLLELAGIV